MRKLDEYLQVKDAAAVLGVSPDTLRRWDRSWHFKAKRHPINGSRLYRREDLERLLRKLDGGDGAAGPVPRE